MQIMKNSFPLLVSMSLATMGVGLFGCNSSSDDSSSSISTRAAINNSVECYQPREEHPDVYTASQNCVTVGSTVVDGGEDLYTVTSIYSDGRIDVSDEYNPQNTTTLNPGHYWPEVFKIQGYDVTETSASVLDGSQNRYGIKKLFANGETYLEGVYNPQSTSFIDIRDLAVEVAAVGQIKDGSDVIDRENNHYRVRAIYSNGELYVESKYNSESTTFINSNEVSVEVQ